MNDHATSRIANRDRFIYLNPCITEILRRDRSEDIGRHHAQGWPPFHEFSKRTPTVPENDPVFTFLDDVEIALNPTFEAHQNITHLILGKSVHGQRLAK